VTPIVDAGHERAGMTELRIHTDRLALNLIPDAGGKILDLIDVESGFNLLWQNPRIPLGRTYAGAPFDDVWCGGWDDMFPTDIPCEVDGNSHHDHGDLWIGPWEWDVVSDTGEQAVVHLRRYSPSLPCRVDKWITVDRASAEIRIRLALSNEGSQPVRFLWNQHIAHAIGPGSRVHLPVRRLLVAGPTQSRAGDAREVTWPVHDGSLDLSRLPGNESGVTEFLCAEDLQAGWCTVTHPGPRVAVRLGFDPAVFRTPWLWGVFGGWRGHHLLLTELCTSRPGSLATAVVDGSAATLAAGATLDTEVVVTVSRTFDPDAPGDEDPLC
jgi:hypothetical protein